MNQYYNLQTIVLFVCFFVCFFFFFRFLCLLTTERGKPATFHAFICAADEDFSHVMTLLETLEGKWGLRLCFGPRDLIAGDSHTVNATVVHLR